MMKRDSIIEKIKALLAKTTANGCTEAEMLAALDKAAAMQDAYDISDEELQLTKAEKAELRAEPDPNDRHGIKWRLSYAIERFANVRIFRKSREPGLNIIGMPSDAEFAIWLFDALADFVFAELYAHLVGCLAPRSERRIIIRSFVDACCDRIATRMMEFGERSKTARTANGRELMVIKDAAIQAYMKEQKIRLRASSARGPTHVNQAAVRAGYAAGERASFGRPVSGIAGMLRITKL